MKWIIAALAAVGMFTAAPVSADADGWIDDDDNVAVMQHFVDTVGLITQQFGLAPITVYTAWLDPRAFAQAGNGAIIVNKRWSTGTYEALAAAIQDDINAGFHNGGCGPIETIAAHETAHIIDQRRGYSPSDQLAAIAVRDNRSTLPTLAGYSFKDDGSLNATEAIAEAFQAYECGTADPVEVRMYNLLVH